MTMVPPRTMTGTKIVQFRARPDDQKRLAEIQRKLLRLGVSATVTDAIRYSIQVADRIEHFRG